MGPPNSLTEYTCNTRLCTDLLSILGGAFGVQPPQYESAALGGWRPPPRGHALPAAVSFRQTVTRTTGETPGLHFCGYRSEPCQSQQGLQPVQLCPVSFSGAQTQTQWIHEAQNHSLVQRVAYPAVSTYESPTVHTDAHFNVRLVPPSTHFHSPPPLLTHASMNTGTLPPPPLTFTSKPTEPAYPQAFYLTVGSVRLPLSGPAG